MEHKQKITITAVAIVVIALLLAFFGYKSYGKQSAMTGNSSARYMMGGAISDSPEMMAMEMEGAMAPGAQKLAANPTAADADFGLDSVSDESSVEDGNAQERLIIKDGSMSVVVDDVNVAMKQIAQYATASGGFVVSQNVYDLSNVPSGRITVRIPSEKFDEAMTTAGDLGEVQSQSSNGRDVTEEYVDLDARLKTLKASEDQFLQIMNRAVEIEDVLAVQRELTYVRQQIESIEGRMKYLTESAQLSSLSVNLSTDARALPVVDEDKWKPLRTFKEAARDVVDAFKLLGDAIIWFVVYIPVMLIYTLLGLVLFWIGKKIYMRARR